MLLPFIIRKKNPPGSAPGVFSTPAAALETKVIFHQIETDFYNSVEIKASVENITKQQQKSGISWVQVMGLGNKQFLKDVAERYGIHRLELEDVVNLYQRPKMETYEGHVFFVSRYFQNEKNEQYVFFLFDKILISFQETYEDPFGAVKERLTLGKGAIRKNGPDYLCYALMDAIVDTYFPVLEKTGENLDDLELELLLRPGKYSLRKLLSIKRQLIAFRRTIWSERDKINDLIRTENELVSSDTKLFLRDTYDHCVQIIDLVESYKEITSSMMDIYLSSINNRLNEIMKVLAIISTIFIPLTFIVGVYGMNFSRTDPETGKVLSWNMPELYSPYGYIGIWLVMGIIVIFQLLLFYRKGWLK